MKTKKHTLEKEGKSFVQFAIAAHKREAIAKKINDTLKERKIKKSRLAEMLNRHPSEISRWLSGSYSFTLDNLFAIEAALNISILNLDAPVSDTHTLNKPRVIKVSKMINASGFTQVDSNSTPPLAILPRRITA